MHGLDNLNSDYDVSLKKARIDAIGQHQRFSFSVQDIVDHDALNAAFRDFQPDCVVHLAAQAGVRYSLKNPRAYASTNVDGFLGVLEACRARPVRHLIYASSSSVYGANTKVPYHEDDPVMAPVSLYAATKRADELMAQTYAHLYGIACSGVRFFTVYGPWGRPDMAYYSFSKAILEGRRSTCSTTAGCSAISPTSTTRSRPWCDWSICRPAQEARDINPTQAPHIIYNVGNHTPIELERFIGVAGDSARPHGAEALSADAAGRRAEQPTQTSTGSRASRASLREPPSRRAWLASSQWFRAYHG